MILITGATGSNGSEILKRLAASDVGVRAMVRKRPDQRTEALPGVEFVTADFDDPASIRRALEGVDRAFLVTNLVRVRRGAAAWLRGASARRRTPAHRVPVAIARGDGFPGSFSALSRHRGGNYLIIRYGFHAPAS